MERRTFVKSALAGVAGAGLAGARAAAEPQVPPLVVVPPSTGPEQTHGEVMTALPRVGDPGELRGEMLYRRLGTTGEVVSAFGLGGSHIGTKKLSDDEAIRLMHEAIDRGITFMDNSWDYNEGQSEIRMGNALSQGGYRQKVFLMTKLDGRTKQSAQDQLDESLTRLKTDHVDLLQFHEILRFDDPDRIFAEGGALEAVIAAKQAGKVRYIGFTGHKDPRVHLAMLEVARKHGFHFDTAQMPINVMDAHYRSFSQLAAPEAIKQGVAVLGMKSLGDTVILKSNTVTAPECLRFSLGMPVSTQITGIDDKRSLDQAFEVAKTFKPLTDQQLSDLLVRTREAATAGKYELFKTTAYFDTTAKHPEYMGGMTDAVKALAPQGNG